MHGEQMLNIFVAEKTATGKTTCCSMMKCINLPTMDYCNIGHLKSLQADGTQNIQISSRFHQSTELYEQDSSPALNRGRTLEERQSLILIKGKSYTRFFDSSIHDRPIDADNRSRFGDFEGDTIYGSVGKGYLVTAIDRRSRLLVAAKCEDKTIPVINKAFFDAFAKASKMIKPLTLTLDNGTEFLGFKDIEKENNLKVYFADSHSPWQRGSNENINGLIRFFFPRGTDFRNLPQEQLDSVVSLINNRPRKCLGYLSPIEFIRKSVALGLTI